MKVYCISLPERTDLREKHSEVQNFFGDKFEFVIKEKKITKVEHINDLIKDGIVSFSYSGGRKKTSAMLGEFDAWMKHMELWRNIEEPSIIYEDGTNFDIENFKKNDFKDYELVFCDKDWQIKENSNGFKQLIGHNNNYYITPAGALKLLELCMNLPIPLDLHIRNCMNKSDNNVKFAVANPPFIERDANVKHSIQDTTDPNNVNDKQCFRPLFERLYTLKKPKLAIIASHPSLGTGYANIATQLANNMLEYFDVIYLGFQSVTGTIEHRDIDNRIRVFDLYKLDPESPFGFGDKAILPILKDETPDVVLVYNDIGVVSSVLTMIKEYSCIKTVYLDMVYEFQHFDMVKFVINNVDYVFTFCEFWKNYLNIIYNNSNENKKIHVMYHGLKKFPEEILGTRKDLKYPEDAFIVLNMNRNSTRKNIDITIRSFLMFLNELKRAGEDISKVYLQLNCNLCTKDGLHIPNVILTEVLRLGLDKEFVDHIFFPNKGHSLNELEVHSLYNVCDVGLTTSSGEGFGLTPIEHALYNKQIIVGEIPTFRELIDTPYKVKPVDTFYELGNIGGLAYRFIAEDFTKQLLIAYKNRKTPQLCKVNKLEELNWSKICMKFFELVI